MKLKPLVILVVTDATGIGTTQAAAVTTMILISKPLSAVLAQMRNQHGCRLARKLKPQEILEVMAADGIGTTQAHADRSMTMTLKPHSAALVVVVLLQVMQNQLKNQLQPAALISNIPQTREVMDATGTTVTKRCVDITMMMTSLQNNAVLVP